MAYSPHRYCLKAGHISTKTVEEESPQARRPFYQTILDRYCDSWWPETISVCIASASTIALSALLLVYHDQRVPELGLGFTFNAIISILATVSKVALMYAISNAIGQLKWVWFSEHGSKPLFDAEIFDSASRGPQGALQMLVASTRNSIASIGAIATILALALDPFVQQLVQHIPTVTYYTSEAAVISSLNIVNSTFAQNYSFGNQMLTAALWSFDLDWDASCPTGNCTWPQHQSLTLCATCAPSPRTWEVGDDYSLNFVGEDLLNILPFGPDEINTSTLYRDCALISHDGLEIHSNVSITLTQWPNKYVSQESVGLVYPSFNATTIASLKDALVVNDSNVYPHERERWLNDTMPLVEKLFVNWQLLDSLDLEASVSECTIDLCLDTADRVVANGKLGSGQVTSESMQKSLQSYVPVKGSNFTVDYFCYQPPLSDAVDISELRMIPGSEYHGEDTYYVGFDDQKFVTCYPITYQGGMLNTLSSQLDGTTSGWVSSYFDISLLSPVTNTTNVSTIRPYLPNDLKSTTHTQSDSNFQLLQQFNPERVMHDLGRAWTRALMDPQLNNGTRAIHGQVGQVETKVRVQWWWLTLPIALCLSGILLLALTIKTSREAAAPLWKSSVSALLFHGIRCDDIVSDNMSLSPIREMESYATAMRVRLSDKSHARRRLEPVVDD